MKKTYTRIVHLVMLMNLFFASALPASVVAVEQLESTIPPYLQHAPLSRP